MAGRIMLLLLVLVVSAGSVMAENGPTNRDKTWDFTIQTRYAGEQVHNGDGGSTATLESDLGWGLGFAYNLNENFNVGFAMTWKNANYTATVVPEADPADTRTYSNWMDMGTLALTAEWNVLPKKFTPYLNGAIGWTLLDTNIAADIYGGCYYDPWWGYVCGTGTSTYGSDAMSYSIGVGLRLEIVESAFLKIGYEYDGVSHEGTDGVNIFRFDLGFAMR
jgi:opacity protein-like surface antigen